MDSEDEDEELDPELKAEQDREVEEFRKRLESIQRSVSCQLNWKITNHFQERRPKITIPELEFKLRINCVISKGQKSIKSKKKKGGVDIIGVYSHKYL